MQYLQNKDQPVNENLDECCAPEILHSSWQKSESGVVVQAKQGHSKMNVYMIKMQVKNIVSPRGAEILKGSNLWIPAIGVAPLASAAEVNVVASSD